MSFTRELIKFLKNNAEKKFTVPEVTEKMHDDFFNGNLAGDTIPLKMRQGFKDAKKNNQKISKDLRDRFKRNIYISLNTRAKKQEIEKDQEEGRLRYYFTNKTQDEKIKESEKDSGSKEYSEADLYEILADYLKSIDIGNKRINETNSSNIRGPGGNHWLYPDLIGIQRVVQEHWGDRKIFDLMGSNEKIKLWSFEVKKYVNISNVRELYFQAVANSSWANFGYLVVAEIKTVEVSEELNMLANRHGIGVILLDRENPEGASIKIPAQEKNNVDWEMLNRLTINSDVAKCLKNIHVFCKTEDFNKKFWNLESQ